MPRKPLVLYSTNTWLAFLIAERFYGGEHYVWCAPHFGPRNVPGYAVQPPTSTPAIIYRNLHEEVRAGDRHSRKIHENRQGILRGADVRQAADRLSARDRQEIEECVEQAPITAFRPLLYVIPYAGVAARLEPAQVSQRAHPLSEEYLIRPLPRRLFDVIDLEV